MSAGTAGSGPAIELHGVGKRYWVMHQQAMLLRSLLPFARPRRREHWALRGVDLRVDRGETVGVIGRNGAGKTTLLRMLAGVTQPTEGRLRVAGTIAPLIGVGVGFHNEMTGRENVHVNAMLLGLSRSEVEERFDAIAAFADLGDFLDTPVKFYSSGMFLRLGFSVAIHVEPDVLLVDEVLAVGDAAFQRRCFERMRVLQEGGTTIVLVSHNLMAVRLLCPRAVVLRRGTVELDGPVEDAIATHHQVMDADLDDSSSLPLDLRPSAGRVEVGDQRLTAHGSDASLVGADDQVELSATLRFDEDVADPQLLFLVRSQDGTLLYRTQSAFGADHRTLGAGATASVTVPFRVRLGGGGTYTAELVVVDRDGTTVLGRSARPTSFYVNPRLGVFGVTDLDARLLLDGEAIDVHDDMTMGSSSVGPDRDGVRVTAVALPTVLVIGAQKAATTTLYELLRRHPDVFVPETVKETNFLIDEGAWGEGIGWYERLWEPGRSHAHRVDVSPAYTIFPLFRHAPARAARMVPDAKLVYVLRHPVERMVSAWTQLVADGHEHRSLTDALLHEAHYAQVSSYGMQLDAWLAHFDRAALLVLRAEDLRLEPVVALDRLLDHLDLPTGWQPTELGGTWNRSDEKVAVPPVLRRTASVLTAAGATTMAAHLGPRGRIGRRFRRPVDHEERRLDPALADDLLGCFAADAVRLRQIVGPDMDLWGLA